MVGLIVKVAGLTDGESQIRGVEDPAEFNHWLDRGYWEPKYADIETGFGPLR